MDSFEESISSLGQGGGGQLTVTIIRRLDLFAEVVIGKCPEASHRNILDNGNIE